MLVNRMLLGLTLIAILVIGVTGQSLAAYGQDQGRRQTEAAERFIEVAERARDLIIQFRDTADAKGIDVSKVNVAIIEGESLLADAKERLAADDPNGAVKNARDAMRKFVRAIKAFGNNLGEDGDGLSRADKSSQRLLRAVDRSKARIDRLESILETMVNMPPNLRADVRKHLDAAETALEGALAAINSDPPNLRLAARSLSEANNEMKDAFKSLREVAAWKNAQRLDRFVANMEKRIETLQKRLDIFADRGVDVDEVNVKLTLIKALLESAEEKAKNGDMKGAIQDLRNVHRSFKQVQLEIRNLIAQNGR